MPTPPPNPIKKTRSKYEKYARKTAVLIVQEFCDKLNRRAYGTRSYMPAKLDYTQFSDSLNRVVKFCKARPDWTLEVLESFFVDHVLAGYADKLHDFWERLKEQGDESGNE